MKRSELKNIIKPLVKECITDESLLEEGLLSNVISEVMKGMSPVIMESAGLSLIPFGTAGVQKAAMREAMQENSKKGKERLKQAKSAK